MSGLLLIEGSLHWGSRVAEPSVISVYYYMQRRGPEGCRIGRTAFQTFMFSSSWRIIALQCRVCFCCATWISQRYPCVPSLWEFPPIPPASLPSRFLLSPELLCCTEASCQLSDLHTVVSMFQCYSLSSSRPLPALLHPQVCSACPHLHPCPTNRFISTTFLDSTYMC